MTILKQLGYFTLFLFLGKILSLFTPLPASVAGFFLMFFALCLKWVKVEDINLMGQFLLGIAGFLLAPFFVNGIAYKHDILPLFAKWLFIVFVCTLITMSTTAIVTQMVQRMQKPYNHHKEEIAGK